MKDAEATIDVADKALTSLMGPPYWDSEGHRVGLSTDDLNAHSIAQVVIGAPGSWDTAEDLRRFRAKAWAVFPRPTSQAFAG